MTPTKNGTTPAPATDRDSIRGRLAGARAKAGELVTVDLGDGAPVTLEARRPTAGAKWEIQQVGYKQNPDGDDVIMVPRSFWPAVIQGVYVVPGTDERVWGEGEAERAEIAALPSEVVDTLIGPALRALAWDAKTKQDMEGNSEVGTVASSSTSPTS